MPGFAFGQPRRRRRPSLTPMIDVVFLLLVFFMLAARFGLDRAIPVGAALAGGGEYEGAPRLVTVAPNRLLLNGQTITEAELGSRLRPLMPSAEALVVVRPADDARLQRVVTVLDALEAAGIRRVVLAE